MTVTIRDVARQAGVAPSTVSRVIAKNPKISPGTAARVEEALVHMNYVVNATARSLAKHSTRTIALSIARPAEQAFANPFFSELIRGIAQVCQRRDYKLLLSMSSNPDWEVQDALEMVGSKRVDGLILTSVRCDDTLIDALVSAKARFVVIGRSLKHKVHMVNNENVDCARQVTQHLIERGRRRIAFVSGPQDLVVTLDRIEGYRAALGHFSGGLPETIVESNFTAQGGRDAMSRLAQLKELPDAVVAADDVTALGVMDWLKENGLSIPDDVAVVGFNDDPVSAFVNPALTTMRISTYALGYESALMLLDMLEHKRSPPPVILPTELIVRQSS